MFKEIFQALLNNQKVVNDDWEFFKRAKIKILDILTSNFHHYPEVQDCLNRSDEEAVSHLLNKAQMSEDFWQKLFCAVRDQAPKPAITNQEVQVYSSGVLVTKTLSELEGSILDEYVDIYNSQIAIPDGVIYEGDTQYLEQKLKKRWKAGEKIDESSDAKHLQNIIATKAEVYIQNKIIEAAKSQGLPITVLRGVETYKDVGKHLQKYGIKLSKLNELLKEQEGKEVEAEHDIMVLVMSGDMLIITFMQV